MLEVTYNGRGAEVVAGNVHVCARVLVGVKPFFESPRRDDV